MFLVVNLEGMPPELEERLHGILDEVRKAGCRWRVSVGPMMPQAKGAGREE